MVRARAGRLPGCTHAVILLLVHRTLGYGVFEDVGWNWNDVVLVQCLTLIDANHDPWPTLLAIFQVRLLHVHAAVLHKPQHKHYKVLHVVAACLLSTSQVCSALFCCS